MRIRQHIIACLQEHPDGIDDDELSRILHLGAPRQANLLCAKLEQQGLVIRRRINGRIRSFWVGKTVSTPKPARRDTLKLSIVRPVPRQWFWEGNVQSSMVSYLVLQGYRIRSVADTASRQRGIDIVAEKGGRALWVTVKGYPVATERTDSSVQAMHWFKQAIFDIVDYRERDKYVSLAVVLPDFARYHSLAKRITWLKRAAGFLYYWVGKSDEISVE